MAEYSKNQISLERIDAVMAVLDLLIEELITENKVGIGLGALAQLKQSFRQQYREIRDSEYPLSK
jgi:hypothetical protein